MEPKIVSRDAFAVLGTLTRVTPEDEKSDFYGVIWKKFESYHGRIKPYSTDRAYYGVSLPTGKEGVMDYIAGMSVSAVGSIPEGLVAREVPAARYAVFECALHSIGETYVRVFREWLPSSRYEFSESAPVFEQYPPENEPESPVLIYIPVKVKGGSAGKADPDGKDTARGAK